MYKIFYSPHGCNIKRRRSMFHVNNTWTWKDTSGPPRFAVDLVFGARTNARAFLPVLGDLKPNKHGVLEAGTFRLIRTKERQTFVIVPKEDSSRRLLLMDGISGGFRGSVEILPPKGEEAYKVIRECGCHNRTDSRLEFCVFMDPDAAFCCRKQGRGMDVVVVWRWDGEELTVEEMNFDEYEALKTLSIEDEGEEI